MGFYNITADIMLYGKDPHSPKKAAGCLSTELSEKNGHPCPKADKVDEMVGGPRLASW